MIRKIYSKINPEVLLHIVYRNEPHSHLTSNVVNPISEPENFLQAISFEFPPSYVGKPHFHNLQSRHTTQTHEALLVFKGSIELSIYDTDNSLVETLELREGDCYIIINGGHKIKTLTQAQLFEFKNGPYTGPEKDKTLF